MNTRNPYIFVLLKDGFDELLAVTIITRLRGAGLQTKVVGLNGLLGLITGRRGLKLAPDFTLDVAQELTARTTGVIALGFPAGQIGNDPRVYDFLKAIANNPRSFLAGERDAIYEMSDSGLVCPALPEKYLDFAKFLEGIARTATPRRKRNEG